MISIGFPSNYQQGAGLLPDTGTHISPLGRKPLIIADCLVRELYEKQLNAALIKVDIHPNYATFLGECSPSAIQSAITEAQKNGCDCVVGFGGGKAIDTAKGVKIELGIPVIVIPTIASNDSPTSRLAITYNDNGEFIGPRFMPSNPELVLVDTQIIAQAPVRFFIAGIGDALVTKFEAEQCVASGASNFFGGQSPQTAICLADLCYQLVMEHGLDAVTAVKLKQVTSAVEKVTEANILLSGLGFEACGVAAAHAIGMALPVVPEIHGALHGEEVAVGLIIQFVLEERSKLFIHKHLDFYQSISLPACMADLGLPNPSEQQINAISAFATRKNSRLHNMNMPITQQRLAKTITTANNMVAEYRHQNQ